MNLFKRRYSPSTDPQVGIIEPKTLQPISRVSRLKKWLKSLAVVIILLLIILVFLAGWVGWQFFDSSTHVFGGTPLGNAAQFVAPSSLKADSRGRTNILIAGNSVDDPSHPGSDLTDSIMVLSVDPSQDKAFLLSIPRDLLVRVPERGYQKINAAYQSGGMGTLESVIESHLRLQIHYHALVNYAAVRDTVNAVGGIDVVIQSADPRGLYDPNIQESDGGPLRLDNGPSHLDGQTALNLARARGERPPDGRVGYGFPRGDFDRSAHQQQILAALQDKITSSDVLLNPFRLSRVFEALGQNIETDLEINQARRIASILKETRGGGLRRVNLVNEDSPLLANYLTKDGQAALVPAEGINDYSEIQRYLQKL